MHNLFFAASDSRTLQIWPVRTSAYTTMEIVTNQQMENKRMNEYKTTESITSNTAAE